MFCHPLMNKAQLDPNPFLPPMEEVSLVARLKTSEYYSKCKASLYNFCSSVLLCFSYISKFLSLLPLPSTCQVFKKQNLIPNLPPTLWFTAVEHHWGNCSIAHLNHKVLHKDPEDSCSWDTEQSL